MKTTQPLSVIEALEKSLLKEYEAPIGDNDLHQDITFPVAFLFNEVSGEFHPVDAAKLYEDFFTELLIYFCHPKHIKGLPKHYQASAGVLVGKVREFFEHLGDESKIMFID
jgi:hypothetical protein